MSSAASVAANGLDYAVEAGPDNGETVQIAPGVQWLRLPLPFELNHINIWLLDDGDGVAIVDTGINTRTTRDVWDAVFATRLQGKRISRVIVTHLHPDHIGLAGWLTERWGVELWMTRTDYLMCRNLAADTGRPAPAAALDFYRAAGFDATELERYARRFGQFGQVVAPLPDSFRRISHGDRIPVGGRDWEVVIGRGHAPEHACLLCRELNVLISGDQILPTISSNISVWPTEPLADPLDDWLESCARLRDTLPTDVLVLPSHGLPFRGASRRLNQLIGEHEAGLEACWDLCRTPQRAVDLFPALFKRTVSPGLKVMAAGESVAHINYMLLRERLESRAGDDGVRWYQQSHPAGKPDCD